MIILGNIRDLILKAILGILEILQDLLSEVLKSNIEVLLNEQDSLSLKVALPILKELRKMQILLSRYMKNFLKQGRILKEILQKRI
jgi:hypothetical protein